MSRIQEKALKIRIDHQDTLLVEVPKKLRLKGLTYLQRRFCLLYPATGSPYRACLEAGFHANETVPSKKAAKVRYTVSNLMRNKQIKANIDMMNEELVKYGIASAVRIQLFWNDIMEDENQPIKVRMEASRLLAKCYPEFSEKVVVEQHISHTDRKELVAVFQNIGPGAIGASLGVADNAPLIEHVNSSAKELTLEDIL
nr:hypothetical protein 3 [Desulfobulbaceae bacterium]